MARATLFLVAALAAVALALPPMYTQHELMQMPPAVLQRLVERYQAERTVGRQNIVGGEEVSPKFKYAFQAALLYTTGGQFCGGSLVNESWVLTAAHCSTGQNPRSVEIAVHRHDLSASETSEAAEVRTITKIIVHPNYQPLSFNRDVALWKLSSPIKTVTPVNLDTTGAASPVGTLATVTGWGATREGGRGSSTLQEVDVPIISNTECNRQYPGDITDFMICAGYDAGGKDSCQGDSGGPLFVSQSNKFVQIGVVSWGNGCARAGQSGVYARVSELADWILATIAAN